MSPTPSALPRPLRAFLLCNGITTAVCLLTELICWWMHLPETYLNPFFVGYRFFDFDSYQQRFTALHTPAFFALDKPWPFSYPAPAAVVYATFFSAGPDYSLSCFLAFAIASALVVAGLFGRALRQRGLSLRASIGWPAAVLALAYPFWFCFQRANIEIVAFLLIAAGLCAFTTRRPYLAAVCFGLDASLKVVPVLFLALFLSRRQYRHFAVGLLVAGAANVAALAFIGPTTLEAWHGLSHGFQAFHRELQQGFNPNAIGFDHTLLSLYRRFVPITPAFTSILSNYTLVGALLGTVLYFTIIRRLPFLNQVLALGAAALLLPPVSFEYTLIHLYAALGLLALTIVEGTPQAWPRMMPFLVVLALLLSPLSELILHGVRFGGQIKCLLLIALMVLALVRRLPSHFDPAAEATAHAVDRELMEVTAAP